MKALILNNQVVDVAKVAFDVAPPLEWHNCPPECKPGWAFDNGVFTAPVDETPVFDPLAYLEEYRWRKETAGITVNGMTIPTGDRDKLLLTGKITEALLLGTPDSETFKFTLNGTVLDMTVGQVKAIGLAISAHVQKCIDTAGVARSAIVSAPNSFTTTESVESLFDTIFND